MNDLPIRGLIKHAFVMLVSIFYTWFLVDGIHTSYKYSSSVVIIDDKYKIS